MPGIFSFMRDIFDDSREIRLLSETRGYGTTGFDSSTTSQLHLPEVLAPAQYLIDVGLQPAVARRLSSTYMDYVGRYRMTCQSHFDRATRGGHLTEYYREVFAVLFRRTTQAWGSQIVSIIRVQLCQVGKPQIIVRPKRVDICVDDAAKAVFIARLGLKATHLTSDRMVTSPSVSVTSRLEEVPGQMHDISADAADSFPMLSGSSPISSTSRHHDPFSHLAPQTCFPAPYPPPPAPCIPRNALPTSFIPLTHPRDARSSGNHSPDILTLTNLFGRLTTTTLEADSRLSRDREHGVFFVPDSDRIKPLSPSLSPSVEDNSTKSHLASVVESIAKPTKPTNAPRRRKIASLPTRRSKTSACLSPPRSHSAGVTSHPITPCPTEGVVEETSDHVFALPQKTRLVSTLPSPYSAEASCAVTSKFSTPRQRKVHALHKTLPHSHNIPQNQALTPLTTATFSYTVSRSPASVSDTTSYYDSPPTSSDELDTPPSTPPSSHVFLASTSTESLAIGSESDGTVSHKEPRGVAKLPYPRLRYRRLDFTKGARGLGRNEQPLTFTFSV